MPAVYKDPDALPPTLPHRNYFIVPAGKVEATLWLLLLFFIGDAQEGSSSLHIGGACMHMSDQELTSGPTAFSSPNKLVNGQSTSLS